MTERSHPIVELVDIRKVYDADRPEVAVRAVDGISLAIERGEALTILGPSGCGKSTLLHILGCLDRPTSGVYRLDGREVSSLSDDQLAEVRNRNIGFVFQTFNLLPRLSAVENVELPLLYSGATKPRERARAALSRVGLSDKLDRLPTDLSGGQRQRVAIARAIVTEPSMLLCDEPTGQLDVRTGADVIALLRELNAEGTTLVIVTHDLSIGRAFGRAIKLRDGRVELDGPPAEVLPAMVTSAVAGGP